MTATTRRGCGSGNNRNDGFTMAASTEIGDVDESEDGRIRDAG